MAKTFILGGTLVEPGELREIHLSITEASNARPVLLPITVIRGANEGPRVILSAAVHGDELNGTAILREMIEKISPKRLTGTLIVIPIVNILGFLARSRYLPDHRDLNRFFPGTPKGNMAQRIAYRFFEEVVRMADFGIDLHTAISGRANFPHVRADMANAQARKMAKLFGVPVIIADRGQPGMLRRAATDKGIPYISWEGGTSNAFERWIVRSGVNSLFTFLHRSRMWKKKKKPPKRPFQIIVRNTAWIRAERGGLLELNVKPGELLYRGERVARISNPLGRASTVVPSPLTGLVIGVTTSPVVNPGTALVNIAQLKKTLSAVEKYLKEQ
ncbi:MAG: succinylglutamate desuccinylase/aspartoacylase family protein [Pseudomonadota bacterium]